jgi:hypothetical protein
VAIAVAQTRIALFTFDAALCWNRDVHRVAVGGVVIFGRCERSFGNVRARLLHDESEVCSEAVLRHMLPIEIRYDRSGVRCNRLPGDRLIPRSARIEELTLPELTLV